ncbi:hypothetical protein HIM_08409 [Hirsutella minnesotensis 3608]|uniref:Uncharacterized protein n=1 Tax=Hirsutella minnesotensis 3608 TaxID=1043627 RepID=A0A0F8A3N6_9HYPO|nr:hypothetical protein HIM_08409 [Hirsutella minnesotensis 3608]
MDRETDEKAAAQQAASSENAETERMSDDAQARGPTRFLLDPAGDTTHDKTTFDVVTVPCPGGDRLRSWSRDGLMGRYFGAPSMCETETAFGVGPNSLWVRQGIRREAHHARILLYQHPEASEGTTLSGLAGVLLAELQALCRAEGHERRPVLFIAHSIGGLVVKMALARASRDGRYESVLHECYGVAFFGTPHQGSSYFATAGLSASIQSLLQLSSPLPASITDELRVGNSRLQHVDDDFKSVSSEVRVWTFYETIESRLSTGGDDVCFTAPLTSVKSAILGMRHESIFALQSDHANIASFGGPNDHSLRLFLKQLAALIGCADAAANGLRDGYDGRWTLMGLEHKVNVEVHGFFGDSAVADAHDASAIRAWSTRLPLSEFLSKGPDVCLSERLHEEVPSPSTPVSKSSTAMPLLIRPDLKQDNVKAPRFVWVHVPFNNPTWVKSVLQTLHVSYKTDLSSLYGHDFWATRHTRGRNSQHYAHFAKPGCFFTSPRSIRKAASPRHSLTSPAVEEAMYMCLFLPYLHFDSYKRLIERRNLILQRLVQGRARPVPEWVAKSNLELQVIWEYLGHDPPINCRRTLDQFAHPSLRDTRPRDDDQMLYKLTKESVCAELDTAAHEIRTQASTTDTGSDRAGSGSTSITSGRWRERRMGKMRGQHMPEHVPEEDLVRNGNVLMVDQLWLWVLESHTLVSFFQKRESDPIEGPLHQQADLRDSIFGDVNVDLTRQCENALDLAALAALHAVSVLLDRSSHPDLEVFRIFEEAISILTEKLTWTLKEIRTEGFRDKASNYKPIENKAPSIRARDKEEGRWAEQVNRDNTAALLELRDMEDELLTLVHLFERQTEVLSSMHAIYTRPDLRDGVVNGRMFLNEALGRLRDYAHQANEMMRRVRSMRDDYDKLLQMVQRQTQIDEVRLSRLHMDLAGAQSRSVMVFTTSTVIFLPLTFFTGLFGMRTREWEGDSRLPLHVIGAIALPSSFILVAVTLFVAFSTGAVKVLRYVSNLYGRFAKAVYHAALEPVAEMVSNVFHDRQGRRSASDETCNCGDGPAGGNTCGLGGRRMGPEREVSDFWQRHVLERERNYRIPEVNRNTRAAVGRG